MIYLTVIPCNKYYILHTMYAGQNNQVSYKGTFHLYRRLYCPAEQTRLTSEDITLTCGITQELTTVPEDSGFL